MTIKRLQGNRFEIAIGERGYPERLLDIENPPERIYGIGTPDVLTWSSLAVIGPRKATPYGLTCAERFTRIASERGYIIVSGGARGVDAQAHRAAHECGGTSIAVLAGGIDEYYPREHGELFQDIINDGGAVISESVWDAPNLPYKFRARNRITVGLPLATLVCECGLPSGTWSACDYAIGAGRDVLAVPGPITSQASRGTNELIERGATPIISDASFEAYLESAF